MLAIKVVMQKTNMTAISINGYLLFILHIFLGGDARFCTVTDNKLDLFGIFRRGEGEWPFDTFGGKIPV
jgi:hypothetical protein